MIVPESITHAPEHLSPMSPIRRMKAKPPSGCPINVVHEPRHEDAATPDTLAIQRIRLRERRRWHPAGGSCASGRSGSRLVAVGGRTVYRGRCDLHLPGELFTLPQVRPRIDPGTPRD